MRVLVVNDDFFTLTIVEQLVRKVEILNIDTAQNGQDAFEMVKKKQFHLILCDLNMPIMNGYVCAQKIKSLHEK